MMKAAANKQVNGRPWRLAFVGLGRQGTRLLRAAMELNEQIQICGLCDLKKDRVTSWVQQIRSPYYRSVEKLVANQELDALVAAVPHSEYLHIISIACENRIHILKEKPFARNVSEAEQFVDLASRNKIMIATVCQRRMSKAFKHLEEILKMIKKPYLVTVIKTSNTDPPDFGWRAQTDISGGGVILDMGYHMVDIIVTLFGFPKVIFAKSSSLARPQYHYEAEDTAVIHMSFNNGMLCTVILSRASTPKEEQIKIYGTCGTICLSKTNIKVISSEDKIIYTKHFDPWHAKSLVSQLRWFVDLLTQPNRWQKITKSHLAHIRLIDAAYRSIETRQAIRL